jgi:hypothetical protein
LNNKKLPTIYTEKHCFGISLRAQAVIQGKPPKNMYSLYTNPYSGGNGKMFVQRVGPIIYVFVMVRGWVGVKRCGVGYSDFDFFKNSLFFK